MKELPQEVLRLICEYAGVFEDMTLRSLALVNHGFYSAALPVLYGCAQIKFFDFASLESAVKSLESKTRGENYRLYMRRLEIISLPSSWGQVIFPDNTVQPSDTPELADFIEISDFRPDGPNPDLSQRLLTQWRLPYLNGIELDPVYYAEKIWDPLERLLKTVRKLDVLHYAVANNFPGSLLDVIHQYHPSCQIHIWTTQNICLDAPGLGNIQYAAYNQFLDPFEVKLFRSSCLESLSLRYSYWFDRTRQLRAEQEPIIPLVAMAPNLKNIQIIEGLGMDCETTNDHGREFVASFGEPLPSLPSPRSLSLFTGNAPQSDSMLSKWGEHFQFSNLIAINMRNVKSESETSSMLSGLTRLERLFIDADNEKWFDYAARKTHEVDYGSILEAVTPLRAIRIRGIQKISTIYRILKRHGQRLQTLIIEPKRYLDSSSPRVTRHIYPVVTYEDIAGFAKLTPHLRELRLTIERSKGNLQEQQLYHALALFPSLRHLIIDLHYKSRSSEGLWEDLGQSPIHKSPDFTDALVNAAMDANLAMQIWHLIDARRQKENLHRLRNLRLTPIGWDLFEDRSAEQRVMFQLSRPFLISNCGLGMPLEIREIGREERLLQMRREAIVEMLEVKEVYRLPSRLRPIIKSLWNLSTSKMADWGSHWTSFPLEASEESETI